MRKFLSLIALCTVIFFANAQNPKHEFRGAWMHVIFQSQYSKQSTAENKAYLRDQLDKLKATGVNAIVFQVRPQADALYPSKLEPWSRHLTGRSGVAPSPMWDPLQFMIEESHARGMELHAWLNPYRVTTSKNEKLPKNHIYHKHPERFVKYDGKLYFDPGLPENRQFIEDVVLDIISRYDVDAIHMDDYFYPYPVAGKDFPDDKSYKKYGKGMNRGDWRRENVNQLIEGLHKLITEHKPWVRLGISPFGIWRNKKSDPRGSETNGLENYDSLYADVILWTENGWVDYMVPQLYWALEHPKASTQILAHWWNANTFNRHMYYGQSVVRTMDSADTAPTGNHTQLDHKIQLSRQLPNVQGNCWWPGYSVTSNYKGVADSLRTCQQSTVAVIPPYTWIDNIAPEEVKNLKAKKNVISWDKVSTSDKMQEHRYFAVYAFKSGEKVDLNNSAAIVDLTYSTKYVLPSKMKGGYTVVVTAFDRMNNESKNGKMINVSL